MNINSGDLFINSQAEKKELIKVSKFLSLILRHKPEIIGFTLDEQGWAKVDILIKLARQNRMQINRSILEQVVENNDKKRFIFNEDKSKIRANQGHSLAVDLALIPQQPPTYLYHGTAKKFLNSILNHGLIKQNRHHVHLSADKLTAIKVGQRHGKPIVLQIQSGKNVSRGIYFLPLKK